MRQRLELEIEYDRLKRADEAIRKMPPSDDRAFRFSRVDKIKNYIIFADKLISENKDVYVIIERIHSLIDELTNGL